MDKLQNIKKKVGEKIENMVPKRVNSNNTGNVNFGYQASENIDNTAPPPYNNIRKESVMERAPNVENYRVGVPAVTRPSLDELHEERLPKALSIKKTDVEAAANDKDAKPSQGGAVKFGWIIGVLVRCVLNILGGMLYLRISWVAGQAGIGLGSVIILLSALVTTLTALSMCAICTNGEVKGGGAYFMLSRALGPEFGGSMGLIFSLANALGVAMHIVAFAETCRDLMRERGASIVDMPESSTNDMRIIGVGVLIILMCIVLVGVDFEVKMQLILLVVLSVSYVNYIVGTFIPPTDFKMSRGVTGYTWTTFSTNFVPAWRGESFFSVFSVFFPAATGIMAGANISGDLKNPSAAIPKGTLLAILSTTLIYLGALWMVASSAVRDASGVVSDVFNGSITACAENGSYSCPYGIMNYMQTMEMQSGLGPLITAGIFAASLSSALACLVSGPKLFQAVGRDKLFPRIDWFSVGFGKMDEPRRAYVLGFFISLGMVLVGELNSIAPYISNFYLATYALINYACFHGSIVKSPGWRPAFKYYSKWTSLLGAILCVAAMFLMGWIAAICTIAFIIVLYIYLIRKKPDVNWGSSTQAQNYKTALQSMLKLLYTEEHVKNYRPQILALTGNPVARPAMVDFLKSITRKKGLMLLGHIVIHKPDPQYYKYLKQWSKEVYDWLRERKSKAFYCPTTASSLREGLQVLLQLSGMGKMTPNIVIMGFKHKWQQSSAEEIDDYFQLIHEAFDCEVGVGVLRVSKGLDYSSQMLEYHIGDAKKLSMATGPPLEPPPRFVFSPSDTNTLSVVQEEPANYANLPLTPLVPLKNTMTLGENDVKEGENEVGVRDSMSTSSIESLDEDPQTINKVMELAPTELKLHSGHPNNLYNRRVSMMPNMNAKIRRQSVVQKDILAHVNQFQMKIKHPTIHVYWLVDDGGLTLLIPHLLSTNKTFLHGASLKIFTVGNPTTDIEEEKKSIHTLLQKFRIEFAQVTIITSLDKVPQQSTITEFEKLIQPFRITSTKEKILNPKIYITDAELENQKARTYRHLRTRELLLEYSKDASLIVVTQPVPRKGAVSACLYLSWLDILSKNFSPLLFIRGNQKSVLTFYS